MELVIAFFVNGITTYIKHEVNEKVKYLNLLVLLTFLVGQVQFAYASYFCTMKQAPVKSPVMAMASSSNETDDVCTQWSGVIPPQNRLQLVEGNCIKVVTAEKSVVSSFTDSVKMLSHFVIVFGFIPAMNGQHLAISNQLSAINNADPPPLDLPTLNSNLRI